jgi:hypothetical protein
MPISISAYEKLNPEQRAQCFFDLDRQSIHYADRTVIIIPRESASSRILWRVAHREER